MLRLLAVALGGILFAEALPSAQAKLVIINSGTTATTIGDAKFPPGLDLPPQVKALNKVGYMYSRFGIFWLDIWRWDGKYCLYDGDNTVDEIPPEVAAMLLGVEQKDLPVPFWYKFPPGLPVLVLIILLVIGAKMKESKQKKAAAKLSDDPDYQQAMRIFVEHMEPAPAADAAADEFRKADHSTPEERGPEAFRKAVDYLYSRGIPEKDAAANLGVLLGYQPPNPN